MTEEGPNPTSPSWAVPGARVVCVDDSWNKIGPSRVPMLHEVLTIKDVLTRADYAAVGVDCVPACTLSFTELGHDWTFNANCFRPTTPTRTEAEDVRMIKDLTTPMTPIERLDRLKEMLDA